MFIIKDYSEICARCNQAAGQHFYSGSKLEKLHCDNTTDDFHGTGNNIPNPNFVIPYNVHVAGRVCKPDANCQFVRCQNDRYKREDQSIIKSLSKECPCGISRSACDYHN